MLDYFKDEVLTHYIDSGGFVTVDKNPSINSTGNGLLHLAFFCTVLKKLEQAETLSMLVQKTISSCEVRPGLFNRNPWKGQSELTSWDEYFAICALSKLYSLRFANEICLRGISANWFFDNQRPDFPSVHSWHDRFLGLTQFYRLCSGGYHLTFLDKLAVCGAILFNCFTKKADTNMREYIRVAAIEKEGISYAIVSTIWRWQAKRKFVTIGSMVKDYFGETHPFSQLPWID